MIPLSEPWIDFQEEEAVLSVLRSKALGGNGRVCAALERDLSKKLGVPNVLAVSSGTHALEIAMELLEVRGGEVILPSFTFPSVGNAVVRAGGKPVFCEIREPDLNVDLEDAARRIGPRTRALVVTHYAGHPVDITGVPVPVIEDATHALGSTVGGRRCGLLGRFGCLSFHQTKLLSAGEGGALICPSEEAARSAAIFREKGTNRDDFVAGKVPYYSWVDKGSSYVLPELSAAVVRVQLSRLDQIISRVQQIAARYDRELKPLEDQGFLKVVRPLETGGSSYSTYAILVDPFRREALVERMRQAGVTVAPHFVPLHASPFGRKLCGFQELPRTDRLASSLLRLPIFSQLGEDDLGKIIRSLQLALGAGHLRQKISV